MSCVTASVEEVPLARAEMDGVLRAAVDRGDVPGVVAMAANSDGVFYEAAFGELDVRGEVPLSVDSMFRIASMTKAVTSVAAMQLVEEGAIELDAPVSSYLKDFAPKVLEGFEETTGEPMLREPRSKVTIRQLLTHTGGFGYAIWNPLLAEAQARGIVDGPASIDAPLVFEPGSAWSYGTNTDWLGRVVEALRGASLEEVFAEHIFAPLGMSDTSYNVPESKHARIVSIHTRSEDGALAEQERTPRRMRSTFSGGGGLVSTAADYTRFMRMLLNEGTLEGARILAPGTVALMAENHIGELEAGTMGAPDGSPLSLSNSFDFFPESADKFGLGFLLNTEPVEGGRAAGSLAWAGLYNTYFWIDRERDVTGVIMMQILPFYDWKAVTLLAEFERAVYNVVDEDI